MHLNPFKIRARQKRQLGFTIVELLIVIVVIAILASITIVAYNGIQGRAHFVKSQADLSNLNKAIQMYYFDNGSYPITPEASGSSCAASYWCGWGKATGDNFIPGLVPKYMASTPQYTGPESSGTYLYRSPDGVNYKLIRYAGSGSLPTIERTGAMYNTTQVDRWGYWSSEASRLW